jgi:hypothetical protein
MGLKSTVNYALQDMTLFVEVARALSFFGAGKDPNIVPTQAGAQSHHGAIGIDLGRRAWGAH